MRNLLLPVVFASVSIGLSSADLAACGDKYIRLAARLGPSYAAEHTATVLIYMPAGSIVPAAARKIGLHDTLKRAGHRVHAISNEADLEPALRGRRYDIVIADASSAATIVPVLERAPGRPSLVPVFHKQSKAEFEQARKDVRCLIASRQKSYHAAAEIDHVMQMRKLAPAAP